ARVPARPAGAARALPRPLRPRRSGRTCRRRALEPLPPGADGAGRGTARRCRARPGAGAPAPHPRPGREMTDVIVVGAGLAGLAAARDLHRAGADVCVLEARDRPGGRVEQAEIADGRVVQLGGELVGDFHTAYLGLVAELGLTTRPSYVAEPGETTVDLVDGRWIGGVLPWLTDAERE